MKAAAAYAIKKWVEQMYAQEVVTTRVGTASGKIDTDEGMHVLEYWIRWQEREGVWIHDDVLPSISIDDDGLEHCSHIKRKTDKVRIRTQKRCRVTGWLQVYGRASPFAIRIRHPHALKDAVQSAAKELAVTYSTYAYGVRKFPFTFPMKAIGWLQTGIPSDEERYVSLRLKAARRLVQGKAENEWGAKKQLVERSIISATA